MERALGKLGGIWPVGELYLALAGAIGTLAGVIGYLGRDLIRQRDAAITGWRESTEAVTRMARETARIARALEARNRRDRGER